jgi:hypothetical protein
MKPKQHGYYDLAIEIIRQWNEDGRPRGDMPGIRFWADLIAAHERMMRANRSVRHGSVVRQQHDEEDN